MEFPSDKPMSLYIHIPFCTTCCAYCAFYSEPKDQWGGQLNGYVQRLLSELEAFVDVYKKSFHTIFIGGGNPGTLSVEQLTALLQTAQRYGKSKEVTIEMNPESFSEKHFSLFETQLVTRLSIGIQSLDDVLLQRIGRNSTRQSNLRALALAQEAHEQYGIDLSFDLMGCLPGQSPEMMQTDIQCLVELADPQHISLYCLTVEEGTVLQEQVQDNTLEVLDEDGQRIFLETVWGELSSHGFEHYEVSNFCKQGRKSEHNLVYWRLGNYIGLGSSASSTILDGGLCHHYTCEQNLHEFSKNELFSGYVKESVTKNEQIEEMLMMGLRTDEGIDKAGFHNRFDLCFDELFKNAVKSLEPSWYIDSQNTFTLTEEGFLVLDQVILRIVMQIP